MQGVLAAGLLIFGSVSLSAQVAAVDRERTEWGATESVVVATASIAVGELLADSVEVRDLPVAMTPRGALRSVEHGSRAKVPLFAGEIVQVERVTRSPGYQLPAASMALTLPVITRVPLVDRGDLIDVWVIDAANLSSHRVASRVVVLDLSDDDITVAVPESQVAQATVATLRPVTIVLVG